MIGDRIFGGFIVIVALIFMVSATRLQVSFLSDPLGSKAFPLLIGAVAFICGVIMIARPDPDPSFFGRVAALKIAITIITLVIYAYSLKPFGFLIPTAITAGMLSYLIANDLKKAAISGISLSVVIFVLFKYILGLGLVAFP